MPTNRPLPVLPTTTVLAPPKTESVRPRPSREYRGACGDDDRLPFLWQHACPAVSGEPPVCNILDRSGRPPPFKLGGIKVQALRGFRLQLHGEGNALSNETSISLGRIFGPLGRIGEVSDPRQHRLAGGNPVW